MPRNETLLTSIDDMVLSLECSCGHRASVNVADLLPKLAADATVQDVLDRARCRACGARGGDAVLYTRIFYDNLCTKLKADSMTNEKSGAVQRQCYSTDDGEAKELDEQFFQETRRGRPSLSGDQRRDAPRRKAGDDPQEG